MQTHSTEHWLTLLGQHDIPCAQVNDLKDLVDDPQLQSSNGCKTTDDPELGDYQSLASPFRVRGDDSSGIDQGAKDGEHSVAVLTNLGYDDAQVQGFIDNGVVGV